jgi:hypothetical protein
VFYPYENGVRLTEEDLRKRYPWTWNYLLQNRDVLEQRRAVARAKNPWWRPVRSRDPKDMLRPKIVCPHLMLTPRFAIDELGKFAVSHTPYLTVLEEHDELTTLRFFCGVLNSSIGQWYLQAHAPKYSRGYNRVEVSLIKTIPVPDPAQVPTRQLRELHDLVERASRREPTPELEARIDQLVADFYGLTPDERRILLGM